jgi:hypothetical protein
MNSFRGIRFILVGSLFTILAGCMTGCVSSGPHHNGGYYGVQGPQGPGFQPGDYALQEAQSLERVHEFASCDGEGFSDKKSQSRTSERNGQRGGYDVRVEQRASCTRMGGQTIPPRGMRPLRGNDGHFRTEGDF